MATIQGIYIALFGRPADPLGLEWFNDATNNGADLTAIGDLAGTAEYQDRFDGMNNQQIVTAIYQSLFGRNPDLAGLTYFVNELNSGRQNINTIAINILDGAQNEDAALVAAKVAAANQFTAAVAADPDALAAYTGESGAAAGRNFLSQIDDPTDELTDEEVADWVADLGAGGIPGQTFTLTTDAGEQIVGTDDNDTINAIIGTDATLNNFDSVEGGGGDDTMFILADGAISIPATASVSGVETINFINAATVSGSIDASVFQGANTIRQTGDAVADVDGLATGQTVAFANVDASSVLTAADGATSLNVALEGAADNSTIEFEGDALATVTVSGAMEADGDVLDLHDHTDDGDGNETIETLNVSLSTDTDVDLSGEFESVVTFNASGSTGDINVDLSSLVSLESATFGAGSNEVGAAISDDADTSFDLGAGNDILTLDGAGDAENSLTSVTLGDGNDTFAIDNALTNLVEASEADFEAGLISVTDFDVDEDFFDVTGLTLTLAGLNNTELGNIRDADSLFDAVDLAAGYLGVGEDAAVFNYGGNAYLFVDNDAGGTLSDGDGLVELVGVNVNELDAAAFAA